MSNLKLVNKDALLYYHQLVKTALGGKVDKKEGFSLMSDAEILRLASVINYDDTQVQKTLQELSVKIAALEAGTYDDTELRTAIANIQNDISSLNSSVIKTIKVNGATVSASENIVNINIPTSVAELSDAENYLTSVPDEYITESELSQKGYALASDTYSKSELYTKTEIDGKISKAVHYKGSIDNYSDLPSNPEAGDMYNIKNADSVNGIKAGDNVVWDDELKVWDNQGGIIDLSGCVSTDDIISNEEIDAIWNS